MHSIYLKVNSGDAKVFSNDIETEKKPRMKKVQEVFRQESWKDLNREFLLNVHNNISIQIAEHMGKCKNQSHHPVIFRRYNILQFFFSIFVIIRICYFACLFWETKNDLINCEACFSSGSRNLETRGTIELLGSVDCIDVPSLRKYADFRVRVESKINI